MRSVGVEEELLLVDARSGEPLALSGVVLAAADRSAGHVPGRGGDPAHT
ncbi:carboxylate--amine ligase, partial [Streptomyces sp. NPDC058612]